MKLLSNPPLKPNPLLHRILSCRIPSCQCPPAEFSDWDGFSDTLSFNSASDAFTDNHTDSEPEGIDTSWLYTTVEE